MNSEIDKALNFGIDKISPIGTRIALIGNMNNNFFSIHRYFIQLGYDSHLYLFNDELKQFFPENDTWDYTKYKDSISQLNFGRPIKEWVSNKRIDFSQFDKYNFIIGCGYAPYYFSSFNRHLDLFIPYGADLYQLSNGALNFKASIKSIVSSIINKWFIAPKQLIGIKKSNQIICNDLFETYSKFFQKTNLESIKLHVPVVFKEPIRIKPSFSAYLDEEKLKTYKFRIINHSRQYWQAPIDNCIPEDIKYNNLLIEALSKLVTKGVNDIGLILFEYGPDVNASKKLIKDLKLEDYVVWSKLMPRKYILALIDHYVHIGSDQFGGGYFGGTGYEVMSCGKPLLNYIRITPENYRLITGCDYPPIINVSSAEEICEEINTLISDQIYYVKTCKSTNYWFDKNCGNGLMNQYVQIISNKVQQKFKHYE